MVPLMTLMGAFALIGGGIGYLAFPAGLELGIKSFINLKEDGFVFPSYAKPPVPSISSYYIYEIKNPK